MYFDGVYDMIKRSWGEDGFWIKYKEGIGAYGDKKEAGN